MGRRSSTSQVLAFRIEQFDDRGNRLDLLTVEVRGKSLSGDVAVGDRVAVRGRLHKGVVRAKRVANLTTGGTVRQVGKATRATRQATLLILILIVLAAVAFGMYEIISHVESAAQSQGTAQLGSNQQSSPGLTSPGGSSSGDVATLIAAVGPARPAIAHTRLQNMGAEWQKRGPS